MKKNILFLLFLLIPAITKAQDSQTGYNFLRLPVSAHAAALGGYNITLIEDDPSLIFQNPALLATVSDKSLNLNFMTYMEGVTTASAAFNRVVKEKASWAVMAQYIDYGSMKEVDENNVETGEFSARDIAISGAFSYFLTDKLVGGITAKFITSYIGSYNSLAVGVDLGLNYYDPEHDWSVSLVAKNLGGQVKAYDEEYEKMPIDVQAGVSKRFGVLPLRLSLTMDDLNHWDYKFINHFIVGIDILISQQLYIAGGYNFRHANEMGITDNNDESSSHGAAFSFGAGLQLERFKIQVGYGKYHVSSNSILVNVSYNF